MSSTELIPMTSQSARMLNIELIHTVSHLVQWLGRGMGLMYIGYVVATWSHCTITCIKTDGLRHCKILQRLRILFGLLETPILLCLLQNTNLSKWILVLFGWVLMSLAQMFETAATAAVPTANSIQLVSSILAWLCMSRFGRDPWLPVLLSLMQCANLSIWLLTLLWWVLINVQAFCNVVATTTIAPANTQTTLEVVEGTFTVPCLGILCYNFWRIWSNTVEIRLRRRAHLQSLEQVLRNTQQQIQAVRQAAQRPLQEQFDESTIHVPTYAIFEIEGPSQGESSLIKALDVRTNKPVRFSVKDADDTMCTICRAPYAVNEEIMVLPSCQHSVHADCGMEWWRRKMSCARCTMEYEWVPQAKEA